ASAATRHGEALRSHRPREPAPMPAKVRPPPSEAVAQGAEHVTLGAQETVAARQARRVVILAEQVGGVERQAPVLPAEFGVGIDQRVVGRDDSVWESPAVRAVLA